VLFSPPVYSLVSSPRPEVPRRRGWVAPLVVLTGALLVYAGIWLLPRWLRPGPGKGTLAVLKVEPDGQLTPLGEGAAVPGGTRVAFSIRVAHDASVVLVGVEGPGRSTLLSPITSPARRVHPGPATVLPERWTLGNAPGTERFLAVLCNTPLPPATVVKAAERALHAAGGDPARIATLDLGCPEASVQVQRSPP
jgi:hypothetical protein